MKKIAIFSVNAQYKIGGAETCIKQMVDILSSDYDVTVISGQRKIYEKHNKYNYKKLRIIPLFHAKHLNYFGNFVNYFLIYKFFNNNRYDVVIGNCSTCLGAINATNKVGGKAIYYVHEEFSINKRPEYGLKNTIKGKLMRFVRRISDYPFFLFHCKKNTAAINGCFRVIANSQYIASALEKQSNINPLIMYPFTDTIGRIKTDLKQAKYITMIGSGEVKGITTFLNTAKLMPNLQFRVIGRNLEKKQIDNVLYHPFFNNTDELYATTKLLLVPSIWQEAFGKVSLEAASHSIPVIVSNRGGLPETVCSDELIVGDYLCEVAWKKRIEEIMQKSEIWAEQCYAHALKFDQKMDETKLRNILKEAIGEK